MRRRIANRCAGLLVCARTDGRLLVRLLGWRVVLPILKHVVPIRTLAGLMSAAPGQNARGSIEARRVRRDALRQMLIHGGRVVMSGNCLERSLVLYRLLSEVGEDPRLVMGVRKEGDGVGGHVWIELDGQPIEDTPAGKFAPLVVFGAGGERLSADASA